MFTKSLIGHFMCQSFTSAAYVLNVLASWNFQWHLFRVYQLLYLFWRVSADEKICLNCDGDFWLKSRCLMKPWCPFLFFLFSFFILKCKQDQQQQQAHPQVEQQVIMQASIRQGLKLLHWPLQYMGGHPFILHKTHSSGLHLFMF